MEPHYEALEEIAVALNRLGNNGAATSFGAIEAASMKIREGLESVADALRDVASAIREARK